jgi:hypothetical protein
LHENGIKMPVLTCDCFHISRRQVLAGLACSLVAGEASAQQKHDLSLQSSCSFYPDDAISPPIYSFASSQEALEVVRRITNAVGLEPNFEILQANVPNAVAAIEGKQRVIFYSLVFIQQITKSTASEWAARTILAHEIGHHLNGDTLLGVGSRPPLELNADRFAGRAVRLMGGSLDQAMAAYQPLSLGGTATHPPKGARLEAVARGWTDPGSLAANSAVAPAAKDADAVASEIIEGLRLGNPPFSRMSPALFAAMREQQDESLAKIKRAGPAATVKEQGRHFSADGNIYYLYNLASARENLSCILGIDRNGSLNLLYCQ